MNQDQITGQRTHPLICDKEDQREVQVKPITAIVPVGGNHQER